MTYEIKYRKEEEMKDSGIEWLGKVPREWRLCKIKDVASLKTGNSISATDKDVKYSNLLLEYYPYIGTKDIDINTNIIEYDNELYIPKNTQFKVAKKNTVLICIEGGSAGCKIGYLNRKSCYVNKLCNIEENNKIINRLLYYILQSDHFAVEFFNKMTGIIPGVSIEDFKNINSIIPNIKEQKKISNFLDLKTSEFDSIISKKEKLITKLEEAKKSLISEVVTGKVKIVDGEIVERKDEEMKDSGVEWLGMVPKHWKMSRLKYVSYLSRGFDLSKDKFKLGHVPVYGSNGIIGYHNRTTSKGPNIVIGRSGSIGEINFVNEDFWAHNTCLYIKRFNLVIPKFIYYVFLIMNIKSVGDGSVVGTLNRNNIHEFKLALPLISIQNDLVIYLDDSINCIDEIITKTKLQIQKLKFAKKSLISEAVTGKIDLSDWEII